VDELTEIRKVLEQKKIALGSDQAIKNLKKGNVEKIFVTSNCAERTKQAVAKYAGMGKVEVGVLSMSNQDLGTICKKPFSISILSVLKEK
jgi:large subunit ribosomal protein L30e